MRLIVTAERPDALWSPPITARALLGDNPRTAACCRSVLKAAETRTSRNSAILLACLAFISNRRQTGGAFLTAVVFENFRARIAHAHRTGGLIIKWCRPALCEKTSPYKNLA